MRLKINIVIALVVLFLLTGCSKNDESISPINTSTSKEVTWVTYTHTVNTNDADIAYTIEFLSANGIQTIANHKGNFFKRVPVMQVNKNGETYAKTMVTIKPITTNSEEIPALHSQLTIKTDSGFILAQAGQTTFDCGYDERSLNEEKPLSWFSYKF